MKCEICNKDILDNSQYINGKYYHNDCIEQIQQENKQLKDNWNKLKEYVNEVGSPFVDGYGYVQIEDKIVYVDDVLDKMQELEKGDSNE